MAWFDLAELALNIGYLVKLEEGTLQEQQHGSVSHLISPYVFSISPAHHHLVEAAHPVDYVYS